MPDHFGLIGFGEGGWGFALVAAAGATLALSILGFALGALIGALAAWARIAGNAPLRILADAYGTLFRGVPDLLTLYLFYFGGSLALTAIGRWFGATGFIGLPVFLIGVLALGVISGAYQAEVYRGAFNAVSRGELDAARAFGMSRMLTFRRILAPQLLRYALPGLGNVWQLVLKDSALVSVIGLVELMRQAQIGAGSTRQPFLFYGAAAALYLLLATATSEGLRRAERRSWRGVGRA